jgi:carboxymuconolactone decarboxylase family protein
MSRVTEQHSMRNPRAVLHWYDFLCPFCYIGQSRNAVLVQHGFCIDMHTKDARAGGETEQRIYALNAWRETPFFSERERAALAWAEALTHIGNGVPDDLYAEARKEFSEKELVDLTWAAAAINVWNRVSISMRAVPGSYQPKGHPA